MQAAILQQTSQYILDLEDEKTALLSQNSQLKRILGEQEGGGGGGGEASNGNANNKTAAGLNPPNRVAIKKRKLTDNVITLHTISDSSDEGLGSMSPEPMTLLTNATGNIAATGAAAVIGLNKTAQHVNPAYVTPQQPPASAKDLLEIKKELDKERRLRNHAEEELRLIKRQIYQTNYIPREVIEHTDNIVRENEMTTMQYVEIEDVGGNIGHQQVVVCSSIDDIPDEGSELISEDNLHEEVIITDETDIKYSDSSVLQPILQAAIKATPKVEVERINETMKIKSEKIDCNQIAANANNNNTSIGLTRSRQNLETIVEAIRHLEGDHLFGDVSDQQKHKIQITAQDTPLALTTKQLQLQQQQHSSQSHQLHASTLPQHHQQEQHQQHQQHQQQQQQRKTIAELSPFLQIKNTKSVTIVNGTSITLAPPSAVAVSLGQIATSNNNNNNNNSSAKVLINTSSSSTSPSSSLTSVIGVGATLSSVSTTNSGSVTNSSCNTTHHQQQQQNNNAATPTTAIVKVQTAAPNLVAPTQMTVTATALKQCRPGVIVAKQVS